MSKVSFTAPRIDVVNIDRLKRDVETTFESVSDNFDVLQNSVPNYWTTEEPVGAAPLSQILVSADGWVPETLPVGTEAAVFMWLTPAVPDSLLESTDDAGLPLYPGRWVNILNIPA